MRVESAGLFAFRFIFHFHWSTFFACLLVCEAKSMFFLAARLVGLPDVFRCFTVETWTKCTGKSVNRARVFFMFPRVLSLDFWQRQQWTEKKTSWCTMSFQWWMRCPSGEKTKRTDEKISTRDWIDVGLARFRSCKSNWIANAFLLITHNMWYIWAWDRLCIFVSDLFPLLVRHKLK